jgi:hypothetical protein
VIASAPVLEERSDVADQRLGFLQRRGVAAAVDVVQRVMVFSSST